MRDLRVLSQILFKMQEFLIYYTLVEFERTSVNKMLQSEKGLKNDTTQYKRKIKDNAQRNN